MLTVLIKHPGARRFGQPQVTYQLRRRHRPCRPLPRSSFARSTTASWSSASRRRRRRHGSIIIPDTAKEKPQEGKVIAVGTGKLNDEGKKLPLDVKAGDRILFGKYSGSEVKLDGDEYIIMREEDVLGVLD